LLALLLLGLASVPAEAGYRTKAPISITPGSNGFGTLTGSIGSTRNMSGTTQYLGVWMQIGYPDDFAFITAGLVARDTAGHKLNCLVPFGALFSYLPQMSLVTSDSFIAANYEPAPVNPPPTEEASKCKSFEGILQCCSYIAISSSSYDEPKK
jgi:hypothetical protein